MSAWTAAAPDPRDLGFDGALDAGRAAAEAGAPLLAVPYLERAVHLREAPFVLSLLAKQQRDLGRLEEAASCYRRALAVPGGNSSFSLIGLAAVLCDLRDYDEALKHAERAVELEADNAAALTIVARCIDEMADLLERGGNTPADGIASARARARSIRQRALELRPTDPVEALERRRARAFPLHRIDPPQSHQEVAVEQALPAHRKLPAASLGPQKRRTWWRGLWARLRVS